MPLMRLRQDTQFYTHEDILAEIEEVRDLLKTFGFSTEGRHYNVSTRMWATQTWGRCKKNGNEVTICINPYVLQYGTPEHVHQLIAHEVCHSIIGAKGHGTVWKQAAKALSGCGYKDIHRTESMPEVSKYHNKKTTTRGNKWKVICSTCEHQFFYTRKGKVVQIALGERKGNLKCPFCNKYQKFIAKEVT